MSDFTTDTRSRQTLDPFKRVNYSFGLVLGVDEFEQEQLYFIEKNRLHNRALHGYGTVCGLHVRVAPGSDLVEVAPGIAVNPQGQEIRVSADQCARLDGWLVRNQAAVRRRLGEAPTFPAPVSLYVTLCYRECEEDTVPVPGAPCRPQEESMVASRIADDFELSLSLDEPPHLEETVVRRFGDLLGRIEITAEPGTFTTAAEFEAMIKSLNSSTPSTGPVRLHPDQVCDVLRHGFRVWVTEVRPAVVGDCALGPAQGQCVTLARLGFQVEQVGDALRRTGDITVFQDERPVLLHTRLLQEWLTCGRHTIGGGGDLFATIYAENRNVIRVWIHHPALVDFDTSALEVRLSEDVTPVMGIARPIPNTNIFDLKMADSINHRMWLAVRFDLSLVSEIRGAERVRLTDVLGTGYDYANRTGSFVTAFGIAYLPGLDDLIDVETPGAADGNVLTFRAGRWGAEAPSGGGPGTSDHGALSGLLDDDHPQYLRTDGARPLGGSLNANNHTITGLAAAAAPGQAVRFEQAVKVGDRAGGDLEGAYPNPTVAALRGHKLDTASPTAAGQVLTWDADNKVWTPRDPQTGGNAYVHAVAGFYAVVAAGVFSPRRPGERSLRPMGPVYNKLEAQVIGAGEYLLTFVGYAGPGEEHSYIVKGTTFFDRTSPLFPGRPTTFHVGRIDDQGIRVLILDVRTGEQLDGVPFMVEISLYGRVRGG